MIRRVSLCVIVCTCLLVLSATASAKAKPVNTGTIDNLKQALTVKANLSYDVVSANLATIQPGEPAHSCRPGALPSVWFKYKADRDIRVTFDTKNTFIPYGSPVEASFQDTVMSVYTLASGTPDKAKFEKLAEVSCNDQAYDWLDYSRVSVDVDAGQWYFIRVTPFLFTPMPAGSSIRLNVGMTDLIENGSFESGSDGWTLKGAGAGDDGLDCAEPLDCSLYIAQSAQGNSKLTQTIDSFGGVKLNAGSTLFLAAHVAYEGTLPDATLKLKIVYKDGTTAAAKENVEWFGNDRATSFWLTPSLQLAKPVAAVIVQFIVKDNASSAWFQIDDVQLEVLPKGVEIPPRAAPLALPLPPAAS